MLTDTRKRGMGGTESIFTVERTEHKTLILPWGGRLGVRRRRTGIESRERILTRKALLNRETAHVKEEHQASSVSPAGVRTLREQCLCRGTGQAEGLKPVRAWHALPRGLTLCQDREKNVEVVLVSQQETHFFQSLHGED